MSIYSNESDDETLDNNSNFEFGSDRTSEDDGDIEFVEGEIIPSLQSYPDDYIFKTNQAAKILGTSAQRLRNMLSEMEDIITIRRNDKDQMLFTKADITRLEEIFRKKSENGWTLRETVNSFREKSTEITSDIKPGKLEVIIEKAIKSAIGSGFDTEKFDSIEKRLNEIYEKIPEVSKEEYEKQIEENKTQYEKELEENKAKYEKELEDNKAKYESRVNELENKTKELEESDSKNKDLLIKQLAEADERNKKIKELEEEKAALQKQLEEQSKKKGLFGFFRK